MKKVVSQWVSLPSLSGVFMAVAPLVSSSLLGKWLLENEPAVRIFTFDTWIFVTLGCAVAAAVALLPPTLLALCFGYFLGWGAFLPLVLLNFSAIGLIYGAAHLMKANRWQSYFKSNKRTAPFFEKLHQSEIAFIFFVKLSPMLPFALTNLLFAVAGIRLRNVLIGGFFGMIPRTLLAIWIGREAQQMRQLLQNSNESIWSRALILALLTISVLGLLRIFTKRSERVAP